MNRDIYLIEIQSSQWVHRKNLRVITKVIDIQFPKFYREAGDTKLNQLNKVRIRKKKQ